MGNCTGKQKEKPNKEQQKTKNSKRKDTKPIKGIKERPPVVSESKDNDVTWGDINEDEIPSKQEQEKPKAPLATTEDIDIAAVGSSNGTANQNLEKKTENHAAASKMISVSQVRIQINGHHKPRVVKSEMSKLKDNSEGKHISHTSHENPQEDGPLSEREYQQASNMVKVQQSKPYNFTFQNTNFAKGTRKGGKSAIPNTIPTGVGKNEGKQKDSVETAPTSITNVGTSHIEPMTGEFDGGSLSPGVGTFAQPEADVGEGSCIRQPESADGDINPHQAMQGHAPEPGQVSDAMETMHDKRVKDPGHGTKCNTDLSSHSVKADSSVYNRLMEKNTKQKKNKLMRQKHVREEDRTDSSATSESDDSSDDVDSDDDKDDEDDSDLSGRTQTNIGHVKNLIIGKKGTIIDNSKGRGHNVKSQARGKKQTPKAKTTAAKKSKLKSKGGTGQGPSNTTNIDFAGNLIIGEEGVIHDNSEKDQQDLVERKKGTKGKKSKYESKEKDAAVNDGIPKSTATNPIAIYESGAIMEVASSVGIIQGFHINGTVFRVGEDKVMTCWHVVEGIIFDKVTRKQLTERLNEAFVDFDYTSSFRENRYHRYNIEPELVYHNKQLDIAILRLKQNEYGLPFPGAITDFNHFNREQHEMCSIYLVGHSGAHIKEMDRILKYWEPMPHRIEKLNRWSMKKYKYEYDPECLMTSADRIMFQCSFRQGASGAPGFYVNPTGKAVLVTVLLRGYPAFFYYDNFEEDRQSVDDKYLKQQGVNIGAVMKDVELHSASLYKEIFEKKVAITVLPSGSSAPRRMLSQTDSSSEANIHVSNSASNLKTLTEVQSGTEEDRNEEINSNYPIGTLELNVDCKELRNSNDQTSASQVNASDLSKEYSEQNIRISTSVRQSRDNRTDSNEDQSSVPVVSDTDYK